MTVVTKIIRAQKKDLRDNIDTTVRHEQIHNPESTREIKVDLYDIDESIKNHLETVVRFKITKNNNIVHVPVIYASPEKWVSMQQNGYLRDSSDKLITPLVALTRTGIEYRDDYRKNEVTKTDDNRWIYEKTYSSQNKYSPFSLLNSKAPVKEYYSVELPRYVVLQYTVVLWCDFMQQLNELVEQLLFFNGTAFGKFTTYIDAPSFEHSSEPGADHYVKATFNLRTKAYLLNKDNRNRPTIQKLYGPNKIILNFHESSNLVDSYTVGQKDKVSIVSPGGVNTNVSININNDILLYLNTNITKTAIYQSATTAKVLNASFAIAPAGLPSTDKNSFYYFINGQNVNINAINTISQNGNDVDIVFNTSVLEYDLESTDEIIVVGKWSS